MDWWLLVVLFGGAALTAIAMRKRIRKPRYSAKTRFSDKTRSPASPSRPNGWQKRNCGDSGAPD